ncbi:MAG TPA: hypothetical protein VFD26_07530, partial [Methyloceanibacter sp.]|nr:hypothetical protein [Methyloceanibacter sp.]
YEYQTLIGVAGALIAAILTVSMMHREQRQQREHFERQMDILTRADRLRVARETAAIIPALRNMLATLRQMPKTVEDSFRGFAKYRATWYVLQEVHQGTADTIFSEITPYLDDAVSQCRTELHTRAYDTEVALLEAFGASPWDPVNNTVGDEDDEAIEILTKNGWLRFEILEDHVEALIEHFQRLRQEYGLPELAE